MNSSAQPRTNFVAQRESGHPGFTDYVFIATTAGLHDLAVRLEELAEAPLGKRFGIHVTERGDPKSRGSLVFARCDHEELLSLQQRSPRVTLKKALVAGFYLSVFVLAVTGWFTTFGYLKHWLGVHN